MQPEMTEEVKAAMDHVRLHHPTVTHVFYNVHQQWMFVDDDFNAVAFDDKIDVDVLIKAAESIPFQPIAYSIDQ